MNKYFKVIKENFLWDLDCILQDNGSKGYEPINDIYKKHEGNEYITHHIVENSPEYFQRVYKVDLVTRVAYEVRDKARELLSASFKN